MKIDIKFDLNQEVYYVENLQNGSGKWINFIATSEIISIEAHVRFNMVVIKYHLKDSQSTVESNIFASLEQANEELLRRNQ